MAKQTDLLPSACECTPCSSLGRIFVPDTCNLASVLIHISVRTLITNKYTKRVLSSIVTHSYMFRPCWVIFRENFFVIFTLRLHFIVE
jgi:hypothetical protein